MLFTPVRDTYGEEGDERKGGAPSIFISPQPTILCSGWWLGKIRTTPQCSTGVVCIKHFMTMFNVENETVSKSGGKTVHYCCSQIIHAACSRLSVYPPGRCAALLHCMLFKNNLHLHLPLGSHLRKVISSYFGMCLTTFGHFFALKDTYIILVFLDLIFM